MTPVLPDPIKAALVSWLEEDGNLERFGYFWLEVWGCTNTKIRNYPCHLRQDLDMFLWKHTTSKADEQRCWERGFTFAASSMLSPTCLIAVSKNCSWCRCDMDGDVVNIVIWPSCLTYLLKSYTSNMYTYYVLCSFATVCQFKGQLSLAWPDRVL